jgi:hypothetical protein
MHPTIGSSESATLRRFARPLGHWPIVLAAHGGRPEQFWSPSICRTSDKRGTPMMLAADRFQKFATECRATAKSIREQENKRVLNGLAERWLRCAKLVEQLLKRRQKHLKIVTERPAQIARIRRRMGQCASSTTPPSILRRWCF